MKAHIITAILIGLIILSGCKRQFQPIKYGGELCTHCKMTIMDRRFAAEIITSKGKAIKFDDLGCLLSWVKSENFKDPDAMIFVADYNHPGQQFLNAYKAIFIHIDALNSPMNGNFAATASDREAKLLNKDGRGKLLNWIKLTK